MSLPNAENLLYKIKVGLIERDIEGGKLRHLPNFSEDEEASYKAAWLLTYSSFGVVFSKILDTMDHIFVILLYKLGVILFAIDPEPTGITEALLLF